MRFGGPPGQTGQDTASDVNILITGASGLIGNALVSRLSESGHRVARLRRAANDSGPTWDPEARQIRLEPAGPLDAAVHLAGETIAQRWTTAAKKRIRASRVDGTRLLSEALAAMRPPPGVLVCASATGFYGDRGDAILDENSRPGTGFLADLCQEWEAAAALARQRGIRVVHLRLGIVLARQGGALAKMLPVFRLGLGGRLGNGKQYWSWIDFEDLLRIVELALADGRLSGALNAVAPGTTTNASFTAALARALHRPAFAIMPTFVVRALFGQMGREALLASARVQPTCLLESGFRFRYGELATALRHTLVAPP
jgi:uncharacterized protein (TIGR01777 family)